MMRGLPPGFRFEPTEEELVFEYLKCKVFSSALPASIIPEINGVWNLDPWDIPATGGGDEEKYLFSKKEAEEYNNNNNNNGEGGGIFGWSKSGYWKARGREKEIVSSENGVALMGMKNTLDFYNNNIRKTKKTGWVMHQYRLIIPHSHSSTNKWVLCHILSPTNKLFNHIIHRHRHPHRRRLHYSISSTKDENEDEDDEHANHINTSTAFSDDEHDSVSSTASSSSTSATFTDFTSTTTTTTTTTFHF